MSENNSNDFSRNSDMKVLHITNAFPTKKYSSFGIFVKEQIDSLNDQGFRNDHYFINAWEKGKSEYFKHITKIKKMSEQYDIIHCHHLYTVIPFTLSFSSKPYLVSILGDLRSISGIGEKLIYNLSLSRAKRIIYKNKADLENKKLIYMPNGVNTELFKPGSLEMSKEHLGLDPDKDYAVFVSASGTKSRIKRYDKFKEVLRLLKVSGTELEPLILSGVERLKVPLYYNAASVMLLTSDHEGSPNAVKEAMACNLPVVSTDVGNVADMLEGSKASFIAGTGSCEELAELVSRSLKIKERNERDMIIQKGLDIKNVARKLKELYTEILS